MRTEAVEENAEGVGFGATNNVGELGKHWLGNSQYDRLSCRHSTNERVKGEGGDGLRLVLPGRRSVERAGEKEMKGGRESTGVREGRQRGR